MCQADFEDLQHLAALIAESISAAHLTKQVTLLSKQMTFGGVALNQMRPVACQMYAGTCFDKFTCKFLQLAKSAWMDHHYAN